MTRSLPRRWMIATSMSLTLLGGSLSQSAIAQTGEPFRIAQSYPECEPPAANEYLLMVIYRSPEAHAQLEQALPRTTTATICNYLGTTVTRVGGFTDAETANSWAQFLADVGGLQAFVARPVGAPPSENEASLAETTPAAEPFPQPMEATEPQPFPSPTAPVDSVPETQPDEQPSPNATAAELVPESAVQPAPVTPAPVTPAPVTPAPDSPAPVTPAPMAQPNPVSSPEPASETRLAYNPQVLGAGYAVLVEYGDRPEVAAQLRQVTTNPVGLVAYQQRPYLLAVYTNDLSTAASLLQTLSDRNFSAMLVDGRRAVLLTPRVAVE